MRFPHRLPAALVSVALLVAGCAGPGGRGAQTTPSASAQSGRTLDPALADRLDTAVPEAMEKAGIPGAMVGIWSPEGDYVRAFGVADTTTGSPMKTDFYSRIGSVTKTFTATAVLQLVGAGKVGLDDPVARYLDGVPGGEAITVRQLADMRSGLIDYTKTKEFLSAITANPQRDFTPQELLGWAFAQPPQSAPGQKVDYSNTNYILLGLLVEKVAGLPFGDYLKERILEPLALADTSFVSGNQFPEPHARGYTEALEGPSGGVGPPVDATDWSTSFAWAAGAMVSTLDDMRIWVPALATGALVSPELQQQRLRTTPWPGGPPDIGYGLGIFTAQGWLGHNGSVPGFQTVAVYLPQRQMSLVVMINTDVAKSGGADPSEALAAAITSVITPDHVYKT